MSETNNTNNVNHNLPSIAHFFAHIMQSASAHLNQQSSAPLNMNPEQNNSNATHTPPPTPIVPPPVNTDSNPQSATNTPHTPNIPHPPGFFVTFYFTEPTDPRLVAQFFQQFGGFPIPVIPIIPVNQQPHFQGQPPASDEAIKTQLHPVYVDSTTKSCPVCCEVFNSSEGNADDIVAMPCSHPHHRSCLESWLKTSNTCPVCRFEIATDNAEYNVGVKSRMRSRMESFIRSNAQCQNKLIDVCSGVEDDVNYVFECEHVFCESCLKRDMLIAEPERDKSLRDGDVAKCPACRKESVINIVKKEVDKVNVTESMASAA